jgi:hypothetical protein
MAIERRRKADERVKPFSDESFRKPSLDAGNLLDRHKFEQNLIRFGYIARAEAAAEAVATTVAQNIANQATATGTPADSYWTKIANDIYYQNGDANLTYDLNISGQVVSSKATGTAPFSIASTTVNANLNADLLDGHHATYFSVAGTAIKSNPQTDEYRIKYLRLDAGLNMVVVYDDTPEPAPATYDTIVSNPGSGEYRIIAMRLNSGGAITVVYDDVPEA